MSLKTHEEFRKRTQNELKLNAQMHEIEPKFELFGIAHAGAGNWILVDAAATEIARLGETRGTAREFKKCPEQSQNVAENKAHHFS